MYMIMWAENDWIKMKKLGERTEWKWGYEKRTLRFCVLHDRLEEMVLLRALAMWKILHVILLCHRWLRRIFGAFFWNTEAGISLICHKRWFTASKAECNSKKKKKKKKKKKFTELESCIDYSWFLVLRKSQNWQPERFPIQMKEAHGGKTSSSKFNYPRMQFKLESNSLLLNWVNAIQYDRHPYSEAKALKTWL